MNMIIPETPFTTVNTKSGKAFVLTIRTVEQHRQLIVQKTNGSTIIQEIHSLPARPPGSPTWENAVMATIKTEKGNGLAIWLGDYSTTWLFNQAVFYGWDHSYKLTQKLFLVSLGTSIKPHKKFLQEIFEGGAHHWPPLMHTRWLETLLECREGNTPKGNEQTWKVPEGVEISKKLEDGKRATILSMVRSAPEELKLAKELATRKEDKKLTEMVENQLKESA